MTAKSASPIGYLANKAARAFNRTMERRLRELGVLPAQFPVLLALEDGCARSQKSLVEIVGTEQPTMVVNLARMERDGLISRETDPADRRSTLIRLTPDAIAKAKSVAAIRDEINASASQGLSIDEVASLRLFLLYIIDNLNKYQ
ncbi:MarR family winged helix-turn-helix transcriptional regulator [Siculibacillus lacustris]|nr:MarR family transcriptional regulator [Siculibacillus lacustris]